jgi:hypothetical protein
MRYACHISRRSSVVHNQDACKSDQEDTGYLKYNRSDGMSIKEVGSGHDMFREAAMHGLHTLAFCWVTSGLLDLFLLQIEAKPPSFVCAFLNK